MATTYNIGTIQADLKLNTKNVFGKISKNDTRKFGSDIGNGIRESLLRRTGSGRNRSLGGIIANDFFTTVREMNKKGGQGGGFGGLEAGLLAGAGITKSDKIRLQNAKLDVDNASTKVKLMMDTISSLGLPNSPVGNMFGNDIFNNLKKKENEKLKMAEKHLKAVEKNNKQLEESNKNQDKFLGVSPKHMLGAGLVFGVISVTADILRFIARSPFEMSAQGGMTSLDVYSLIKANPEMAKNTEFLSLMMASGANVDQMSYALTQMGVGRSAGGESTEQGKALFRFLGLDPSKATNVDMLQEMTNIVANGTPSQIQQMKALSVGRDPGMAKIFEQNFFEPLLRNMIKMGMIKSSGLKIEQLDLKAIGENAMEELAQNVQENNTKIIAANTDSINELNNAVRDLTDAVNRQIGVATARLLSQSIKSGQMNAAKPFGFIETLITG